MAIKNNLRHILLDRDMSLRELARRTDVTYSMVYDFATLKRQSVKYETLEAICRELQVTPGDLLLWVDDDPPA